MAASFYGAVHNNLLLWILVISIKLFVHVPALADDPCSRAHPVEAGGLFCLSITSRLDSISHKWNIYRLVIILTDHYSILKTSNHKQSRILCKSTSKLTLTRKDCRFYKKQTLIYLALLLLLISTDVHPNPGPRSKPQWKYPCGKCEKPVRSNQKGIQCDGCDLWWHQKCTPDVSIDQYHELSNSDTPWHCPTCTLPSFPDSMFDTSSNSGDTIVDCDICDNSSCPRCLLKDLPFADDDLDIPCPDADNDVNKPSNTDQDFFQCFSRKGLHFLHVNARSLLPKLSELRSLVHKSKVAVLSVTETWLDDTVTDQEISISGYSVLRKDRNRHGGGVAMYIRQDIAFNPRTDFDDNNLESIWCELLLNKTKPIIVGTVYRPPQHSKFIEYFELLLSKIRSDLELYILGDFNICYLHDKSSLWKNYKCVLDLFDLTQLIKDASRITVNSSTLLDHILCNQTEKICQSGTLSFGLSDHLAVFCTRKIVKGQIGKHNVVKLRSFKNYSKEIFCDKLSNIDWSNIVNATNVNEAWCNFKTLLNDIIDSVAPVKEVRIKCSTEPWMTGEILDKIRTRDKLLYDYKKNRSDSSLYKDFCKLRNHIQRDIKCAKASYLSDKIEEHKFNPKKLWKDLKTLGYGNKTFCKNPIVLKDDKDNLIHDSLSVASYINKFFTTVASVLVSKLPAPVNMYTVDSRNFQDFYKSKNIVPGSFKLQCVSEDFVFKELSSLNPHKSVGLDNIGPRFLKDGANILKKPVTSIINLSILSNTVPDELKAARVTPLHKKNSKLDVGNYRPISILCTMSKILEKSVHCQIIKYLNENDLLYNYQSGFRESFSTETCLTWLTDYIREQSSKGYYTGMVMLDVQKAFDSVDHSILCNKLFYMGIQSDWFKSYLSGRRQIVSVNECNSSPLDITCGVPQGSILGPLLYLCYVNDMSISVSQKCTLLLYADDSILLISDKDPKIISEQLGKELESCYDWLIDNKLSLHFGKTECMIFGSKRKLRLVKDFSIKCKDHVIKSQKTVKYLGLLLDQDLSGTSIVNSIIKKSNSKLKFLYRQANFLNQDARKTLCSSLVLCHLEYASASWYCSLSKNLKTKLQIIQNKCVRYIRNTGPRSHIGYTELQYLNWLNVEYRQKQLRLNLMYKIYNGHAPSYLLNNFVRLNTVHSYNTRRSSYGFYMPNVNSILSECFFINSIKDWNSLPGHIQCTQSQQTFKNSVKHFLCNEAKNDEQSIYSFY